MKEKTKKIQSILLFLVIIGYFFANINMIASVTPKFEIDKKENKFDNQVVNDNQNDLGYRMVFEIDRYFGKEAELNNFKISTTVYSMEILYETENSLIIIGHGYYDSNNQYYIADYSMNSIIRMAENKNFVALLACYSSNVILQNELTLTYDNKVDLKSAVDDLLKALDWKQQCTFTPKINIALFDLDPGPGGGISDAPFSNGIKYIYSPSTGIYWNLNSEAGFLGAGNWMIANKYILVNVYILNSYYQKINENSYQLISAVATYDAWVITQSDMNDYLRIRNLKVDGVTKNNPNDVKLKSIRDVIASDEFAISLLSGMVGSIAVTLSFTLILEGIGLINKARLATKTILITVTELGESVLGLNAGPYLLTIPTVNYALMTAGIIMVIIGVLIISAALIYLFYSIS